MCTLVVIVYLVLISYKTPNISSFKSKTYIQIYQDNFVSNRQPSSQLTFLLSITGTHFINIVKHVQMLYLYIHHGLILNLWIQCHWNKYNYILNIDTLYGVQNGVQHILTVLTVLILGLMWSYGVVRLPWVCSCCLAMDNC